VEKIVLAYSGGLDTSVILAWLKDTYQCPVIAYAGDVGQGDDMAEVREKAMATGAEEIVIDDVKEELTERIDNVKEDLTARIDSVRRELTIRIDETNKRIDILSTRLGENTRELGELKAEIVALRSRQEIIEDLVRRVRKLEERVFA